MANSNSIFRVTVLTVAVLGCQAISMPANGQATKSDSKPAPALSTTFDVRLEIFQKVNLAAKSQGFVTQANLTPGTIVQKGQLLAELGVEKAMLEAKKLRAEIAAMQAEVVDTSEQIQAEQRMRVAQVRLNELKQAMKLTHIPRLEIVESETEFNSAKAALDGARAKTAGAKFTMQAKQAELELTELQIKDSTIISPFDGIVFKQFKQPGEAVELGETIAEIYRLDYLLGTVLLKQNKITPQEFLNFEGVIEIEIPSQGTQSFAFQKPQALPRVERDGRFLAVVKVKNKKIKAPDGSFSWALLPGMDGELNTKARAEKFASRNVVKSK